MATKEELLRQLQELKTMRDQVAAMPDDELSSAAPEKPGFWGELGSGSGWLTDLAAMPGNIVKGVGEFIQAGAEAQAKSILPGEALVRALYKGTYDPESLSGTATNVIQRTGDIAESVVPGAMTAGQFLEDATSGEIRPGGEYGKALRQELTSWVPIAGVKAARIGAGRAAQRAGFAEIGADAGNRAAFKYAQNSGLLDSPTAQAAIQAERLTPEVQSAMGQAQREAVSAQQLSTMPSVPSKDYLPALKTGGYPESNQSTRAFAATETAAELGPALLDTNIYRGGPRINPLTGKFDIPGPGPVNSWDLIQRAKQAQIDLIESRRNIVTNLDLAMNSVNQASPGLPKISGIRFDVDVAPALQELRGTIERRKMLAQTKPMGREMEIAYNKVKQSFDILNGETGLQRFIAYGPQAAQRGELTLAQTQGMLDNLNAYRRALGEFDEAAKASGLNSTFSDFTGRGAELYATGKIQAALTDALATKAAEVVERGRGLSAANHGIYQWSPIIHEIEGGTIGKLNQSYGALANLEEMATTFENVTHRGMATPNQYSLIQTVKEGQVESPTKAGFMKAGFERGKQALGFIGEGSNPVLQARIRNLQRSENAVNDVIYGLQMREMGVPVLSRDFTKVASDIAQKRELAARAIFLSMRGLMMPPVFDEESFNALPIPAQKQVHAQVVLQTTGPMTEASPNGFASVQDGKLLNPMEGDMYLKEAINKPPSERAAAIGPFFKDRSIIELGQPTPPPQVPDALERLKQLQAPAPNQTPSADFSIDRTGDRMLELLAKAQRDHALLQ